jgi:hypothetical protein
MIIGYGLYPSGDYRRNVVRPEHRESHIGYNILMRPGRALILDGEVIYRGSVSPEVIEAFLSKVPEIDSWTEGRDQFSAKYQ